MELYLVSAQVALANQSLSQADASLKAAIGHIQEVPDELEVRMCCVVCAWVSSI